MVSREYLRFMAQYILVKCWVEILNSLYLLHSLGMGGRNSPSDCASLKVANLGSVEIVIGACA